jgi:solute carrier family 25 protein 33/36
MPGGHEKSTAHADAPLTQSRETGDVNPESRQGAPIVNRKESTSFAKSWAHMVAGG